MQTLSTGDDSTLGSYMKIAKFFGAKAEAYIQQKIDDSPNGEDEEVIAAESQVLYLFGNMLDETE